MIYIDMDSVGASIPPNWIEEARALTEELVILNPDERKKRIKAKGHMWRDISEYYAAESSRKCWYCETVQDRSDMSLDHFRPKNSLAECPEHPGYWWLAFDWENYRFSCTYCNSRRTDVDTGASGGKQDHFPLCHENTRVYDNNEDLNQESVGLVDPIRPGDPELLWFTQLGEVTINPRFKRNGDAQTKVRNSIKYYHLNFSRTVKRRKVMYRNINRKVDLLDKKIRDGEGINLNEDDDYHTLLQMISTRAQYSAAAKKYLLGMRAGYNNNGQAIEREWILDLLRTAN